MKTIRFCLTCRPALRLLGRGSADLGAHDKVIGPKGVVVLCHSPYTLHRPMKLSVSEVYRSCHAEKDRVA